MRTPVAFAALALLAGTLAAGCSEGDDSAERPPAETTAAATPESSPETTAEASPTPDRPEVPRLNVGDSATWETTHPDNRDQRTEMSVTVEDVSYVRGTDVEEENRFSDPEDDLYVRLELTVANLGDEPGVFLPMGYGMEWAVRDSAFAGPVSVADIVREPAVPVGYEPGDEYTGHLYFLIDRPTGILTYVETATGDRLEMFEIALPEGDA
jgi:hypothetical protein